MKKLYLFIVLILCIFLVRAEYSYNDNIVSVFNMTLSYNDSWKYDSDNIFVVNNIDINNKSIMLDSLRVQLLPDNLVYYQKDLAIDNNQYKYSFYIPKQNITIIYLNITGYNSFITQHINISINLVENNKFTIKNKIKNIEQFVSENWFIMLIVFIVICLIFLIIWQFSK